MSIPALLPVTVTVPIPADLVTTVAPIPNGSAAIASAMPGAPSNGGMSSGSDRSPSQNPRGKREASAIPPGGTDRLEVAARDALRNLDRIRRTISVEHEPGNRVLMASVAELRARMVAAGANLNLLA
jgi:hypothetical protein